MTTSPQNWLDWKKSRNRFFSDPAGFLAITNLVWLTQEPQEIAGLSGSWYSDGNSIHVIDSSIGEHSWEIAKQGDAIVDLDGIKVELAIRGGSLVVRPRDPKSPMLAEFDGIKTFNYDPRYSVEATLKQADAPKEVVVGSVVDGMTLAYVSPGSLVFDIDGKEYELTAFEKSGSEDLSVYFKDATSGTATYGTGRSVTATKNLNGSYTLDFNFAGNFPCAYTDFATCPVAPVENKLPIEISAGEMKPEKRNTIDGIKEQVSK